MKSFLAKVIYEEWMPSFMAGKPKPIVLDILAGKFKWIQLTQRFGLWHIDLAEEKDLVCDKCKMPVELDGNLRHRKCPDPPAPGSQPDADDEKEDVSYDEDTQAETE